MAISMFHKMTKCSIAIAAACMLNSTAVAAAPVNQALFDQATQAKPEVIKLLATWSTSIPGPAAKRAWTRLAPSSPVKQKNWECK